MTRDELLAFRDQLAKLVSRLEHQGDFDAHASSIRLIAQGQLILFSHLADADTKPHN